MAKARSEKVNNLKIAMKKHTDHNHDKYNICLSQLHAYAEASPLQLPCVHHNPSYGRCARDAEENIMRIENLVDKT